MRASRSATRRLRDVLARTASGFARSARDMMRGRQLIAGDEVEEFWALKDVNFEIKRGDVVGIIGRNGAGKSTLLKILSRITEPSDGPGRDQGPGCEPSRGRHRLSPGADRPRERLPQRRHPRHERREIKRKFDEIVAFAEVEKFLDTPVKRYSSGMYVRLAFAVAAHLEPEILIVDEVLAVGDAEFQKKCLGKMQDCGRARADGAVCQPQYGRSAKLCNSGVLLDRGSISFKGPIEETTEAYSSRATQIMQSNSHPRPEKPTITRVAIDPEELRRRNLFIDIEFKSPSALSPPVVDLCSMRRRVTCLGIERSISPL